MSESDFKAQWQSTSGQIPLQRAFAAGLLADCLSFVFIAGYQSAIRLAFDNIPDNEWWSFAVSEDKSGQLPGVTLVDGKLSGAKTWVAACDQVDGVIVTAAKQCFLIERNMKGVNFESYTTSGFLGDMTTGKVTLTDAEAGQPINLKTDFSLAEPTCLMAAGAGYLLRESRRFEAADVEQACLAIEDSIEQLDQNNLPDIHKIYCDVAELGKACGQLANDKEDGTATDWQQNGKLLSMYKKGLAARL